MKAVGVRQRYRVIKLQSGSREENRELAGFSRGFQRTPARVRIGADYVAEDAVASEPVSRLKFPANREIYREFCSLVTVLKGQTRHKALVGLHFWHHSPTGPANRNKDFFSGIREFDFPVPVIFLPVSKGGAPESKIAGHLQGDFVKLDYAGGNLHASDDRADQPAE